MIFWQYLIPQHFLSKTMFYFARLEIVWLKNILIRVFIKKYKVQLTDAKYNNIANYVSFNDFFTRELKDGIRPLADADIVSLVDGFLSQLGNITNGNIIAAKGQTYTTAQLLNNTDKAEYFASGSFATIYLAPKDYHRIHMPMDAKLLSMTYIPGSLFSVNQKSVANIPALLARNERLVCYFATAIGEIAIILVGAIFVGSMQTKWHGQITPPYTKKIKNWDYRNSDINLNKGAELGRFNMGSTVILLLPKANILNNSLLAKNVIVGCAL